MKIILLCAILAALCGPAIAQGAFESGNDLYQDCVGERPTDRTFCLGYTTAVADIFHGIGALCVPKNATAGQVKDVATQYLAIHPEARHFTANSEVFLALKEAFPCQNEPPATSNFIPR